jgi:transposase
MFVGLDVHKEFCQAAFVNGKGKLVREKKFENTELGLQELLKATKRSKVVIEASTASLRIYDLLCETCAVTIAHPLKVLTDRKGHITKQGNSMIRWLLVQCARNASRHSKRFRRKYARFIRKGLGDQRAIVAIARNIAVDMYFMLVRSESYKESKGGKPVSVAGPMRPS